MNGGLRSFARDAFLMPIALASLALTALRMSPGLASSLVRLLRIKDERDESHAPRCRR